jgi:drug/metabolite transporter (DMT)-like permease
VVNSAGMLAGSSVIMLPLVLMTSPLDWSQPSARAIAAILGLATVSTALAYLLYFRILASAGATNALLVTFLIPVSALLLGVGVLGEVINILEYAGMGCIFLGLMVIDGRVLEMLKTFKLIAHS